MEFGKIVIYCLETIEFWLGFCVLFPEMLSQGKSNLKKGRVVIMSVLASLLYAYNGTMSWVSTSMTALFPIVVGVLLAILYKKYALIAMIWELSYLTFIYLLKLAVLLWEGVERQKDIIYVNRFSSDNWVILTEIILIVLLLLFVYLIKREKISVRRLCKQFWYILLLADVVGYKLMDYVMKNCAQEIQKPYLVVNLCSVLLVILCIFTLLVLNMILQIKSERSLLVVSQNMQKSGHRRTL